MRARMAVVAVSWLAVAGPADAVAPQYVVAHGNGYAPSEVVVVQGGTLTLTSADPAQSHDLVSLDRKPGGGYLFRSVPIAAGQYANVAGVSSLAPSVYPFYCSIHEWMVGNVTVVAAGA